jgi:hypothetical protein
VDQVNDPQDILFGVTGQQFYCDVRDGRPTAVASAQVFDAESDDTGTAEAATTGTASVENVTTTTTVAAGASQADRTKITLTSAATFKKDRVYAFTGLTGEFEMVELAKVDTVNNIVYTRTPLQNDFAVGSTLASTRVVISVLDSWAADLNNCSDPCDPMPAYRVRWQLTVNGATRVIASWADLVRYSAEHSVTPADVEEQFPGWLSRLHPDERVGQGTRTIRRAAKEVAIDLAANGKSDAAQQNSYIFNELVLYKARLLAAESSFDQGGENEEQLERAAKGYERVLNLIRQPATEREQVTAGGASGDRPPTPLMQR